MDTNCPFCNPAIGDATFAHSENFLAVYNVAPILPGHSMIIPRNHMASIMELDEKELLEMVRFARKVTRLLQRVFHSEAFDWSVQDKEIAGQTITHLHLHIVLRFPGDFPRTGDWYPEIKKNYDHILDSSARERLTPREMQKIMERLRREKVEDY